MKGGYKECGCCLSFCELGRRCLPVTPLGGFPSWCIKDSKVTLSQAMVSDGFHAAASVVMIFEGIMPAVRSWSLSFRWSTLKRSRLQLRRKACDFFQISRDVRQ